MDPNAVDHPAHHTAIFAVILKEEISPVASPYYIVCRMVKSISHNTSVYIQHYHSTLQKVYVLYLGTPFHALKTTSSPLTGPGSREVKKY
jgi:hypothetical protein